VNADQFRRVRRGDRCWWENVFAPGSAARNALTATTLAQIIALNTGIVPRGPSAFRVPGCAPA
jgi:hypothetical protein